jgi:hypothetical protein
VVNNNNNNSLKERKIYFSCLSESELKKCNKNFLRT